MAIASAPKSETSAPSSGGVQLFKKISNQLFKEVPLNERVRIAGIVRSLQDKVGDKGEYTKFLGDFACAVGSQITKANVAYFPQVVENLLKNGYLAALDAAPPEKKAVSVEFSLFLFKKPDEKSTTGYIWVAETKQAPQIENDKVLALLG